MKVEQSGWNINGGTVKVEPLRWNSNGSTVKVEPRSGKVMVEQ